MIKKNMKIALVTNKELHHKYWVIELYKCNDISLIIHPVGIKSSLISKIKQKKFLYYGNLNLVLKILSLIYGKLSSNGLMKNIAEGEVKYFSESEIEYSKIPKEIIYNIDTVNSPDAIALIKKYNIDVICFLGGDIAKKEFINSAKTCLNYHSGISPYYNGTKTSFHAVSDFRPNFAGGTLMKMNERIDGGEILMHYLCPIAKSDRAEDLFMKGIIGAVKTYQEFFKQNLMEVQGIKQKKTFKFFRNIDWTIINDIKLKKFYDYERMRIYERDEEIIDYINKAYSLDDLYGLSLSKILR